MKHDTWHVISLISWFMLQKDTVSTDQEYSAFFNVKKDTWLAPNGSPLHTLSAVNFIECLHHCQRESKCRLVSIQRSMESTVIHCQMLAYGQTYEEVHQSYAEVYETSRPAQDCMDWKLRGFNRTGIYQIKIAGRNYLTPVQCDMETDKGGWTVFQRRLDDEQEFYNNTWQQFRYGFGKLGKNFWLGNENLYHLTVGSDNEMRVDLGSFENESSYETYESFAIGSEKENYRLSVSNGIGPAGDDLSSSNNKPFSTIDRDNSDGCVTMRNQPWWHAKHPDCLAGLNGVYYNTQEGRMSEGLIWQTWKGWRYSLKYSEMKIRRKL